VIIVDSKSQHGLAERFTRWTDSGFKDVIVGKVLGGGIPKEGNSILYPTKVLAATLIATTGFALYSLSRPVIPALAGIDTVQKISTRILRQLPHVSSFSWNGSRENSDLYQILVTPKVILDDGDRLSVSLPQLSERELDEIDKNSQSRKPLPELLMESAGIAVVKLRSAIARDIKGVKN